MQELRRAVRHPAPRRAVFRLRAIVLLAVAAVVIYFIGFALYLTFSITPQAVRLPSRTVPVVAFFGSLSERNASLEAAMLAARAALGEHDIARMDSLAEAIGREELRESLLLGNVPLGLRSSLASAERLEGAIEAHLVEIASLMDLGRQDEAEVHMRTVDSLHSAFGSVRVQAEQRGFAELSGVQMDLANAVSETVTAMLAWVALGALLVLITTAAVRRRAVVPLGDLDVALTSVAQGDLNAMVPIRYDDEMGDLGAHFNSMTRVLRQRAEEQGRFAAAGQLIAGVAHEVNNPLMAIATIARSRLEAGGAPDAVEEDLWQIRRQAQRAGRLLSGLLRFVRADADEEGAIDLNTVVLTAVDLVSYRFGVDEIVLEQQLADDLPMVAASSARLEQVFVNLISNAADALKQSPRPRVLRVETWAEAGACCAAVVDSGGGVSAAMEPQLFLPFATTKGADGTGLGLYISRQVVRDAGGELTYARSDAGARFTVRLEAMKPDAAPDKPSSPTPPVAAVPLAGTTILLVDDEEAVRSPIARFLRRRGATVVEAGDGLEALDRIAVRRPDVIIADLRMPRMDGVEFCHTIARDYADLADRIVILSGDLRQLGGTLPVAADRVLAKPVELDDIERVIAAVRDAGRA